MQAPRLGWNASHPRRGALAADHNCVEMRQNHRSSSSPADAFAHDEHLTPSGLRGGSLGPPTFSNPSPSFRFVSQRLLAIPINHNGPSRLRYSRPQALCRLDPASPRTDPLRNASGSVRPAPQLPRPSPQVSRHLYRAGLRWWARVLTCWSCRHLHGWTDVDMASLGGWTEDGLAAFVWADHLKEFVKATQSTKFPLVKTGTTPDLHVKSFVSLTCAQSHGSSAR